MLNLSSKKNLNNEISERVIELSSLYRNDREFLKKCDMPNSTLLSNIKAGRMNSPSAATLSKIVSGTDCSGTWLLTGEGEMFEPPVSSDDDFKAIHRIFELLDRLNKTPDATRQAVRTPDVALKLVELGLQVLKDHYKKEGS